MHISSKRVHLLFCLGVSRDGNVGISSSLLLSN
jgi:hypothetical protein